MKKILALVLALAMILMVSAAFAGTVTISNSGVGKTYDIYKVFDATYSGDKVAYTYTATGASDAFLADLQASGSPFTVTARVGEANTYTIESEATGAEIRTWLVSKIAHLNKVATLTGNGGAVTSEDLGTCYFLIQVKDAEGTVLTNATTDSTLGNVTVIDKNQTIPGPDKQEQIENGTWNYEGAYDDSATKPTANVGDTVNYKVTGSFTQYVGEEAVTKLVFTDVMSNGLTANQDVAIKINNQTLGSSAFEVTYSVDATSGETTTVITVPTATVVDGEVTSFLYDPDNTYEITYSAKINQNAVIDGIEENTVDLDYYNKNNQKTDTTPDTTKVKTYKVTLLKVDGQGTDATTDDTPLAGAKFALYPAGGTTPISVVLMSGDNYGDGTVNATKDNTYRLVEEGETGITELVVGQTGKIVVKGLANGSYEFEETEAPAGYNKMATRTAVAIVDNDDAADITAINNHGSELPSTGGIGTTIFYILGGLLVIGAAVVLVARRKAHD